MNYTPLEQNAADLVAILCLYKDSSGLPWIGDNSNWWIGDIDTGFEATPDNKPEIDDYGFWIIGGESTGISAMGADAPCIGDNGNWWIGDVDTGIEATPDNRPVIGDDGNWWIGGESTGIPADTPLPKGADVPCIGDNGNWWIGDVDTGIEAKPGDRPELTEDGTISINGTDTGIRPHPAERRYQTVSYESLYGTVPSAKNVEWGYLLTQEDLPTLSYGNYVHDGWLFDGDKVKVGDKIRGNTVLTALWYDESYHEGYAAGYAQSQADGTPNGAHTSDDTVSVPTYRPLSISVSTGADGATVYDIEELGRRWELLDDTVSESYKAGYEAGYRYGYKYAYQLDGYYLDVLDYIWDENTSTLTVDEQKGAVSELPTNTYRED